jgi:hypothetical protein
MAFLKNKKNILGGVLAFILLAFIFYFIGRAPENAARPDQIFNISAFGTLQPLHDAMEQNDDIEALVQKLISYDEVFIFVNYPQVNNDMATLMFLWAGIDRTQLKNLGGQGAIAVFLRRVYDLPKDEIIKGNPLLEGNPWGDLFNRFKAQILMQGQGYKIYEGLAYYDNELNQMIVRSDLSEDFISGFAEFLKTQDTATRKKYLNNFLLFVRETKGFKNFSAEDKSLVKKLQGKK